MDETEHPEDAAHRFARQVEAAKHLHSRRDFDGDGYGWSICAEDRQRWPCATIRAMETANDA